MKKYSIICWLLLLVGGVSAQKFQHNFEESISAAKANEKNILMVFSGSDWCKPCMQLKKSILSQPEFIAFSEKNLVLLEVDFPYRKKNRLSKQQQKHNEQLAERYNQEGSFPKVLLLDESANTIGEIIFQSNQSTKEFIHQIETLRDRTETSRQALIRGSVNKE